MKFIPNPALYEELLVDAVFRSGGLRVMGSVAHLAKERAPVGETAADDPHPGALRDSIHEEPGEGIVLARVVAGDETGKEDPRNAGWQEFGTSAHVAQPFLRPSAEGFGILGP